MARGDFAVTLGFTVSPARVTHVATCPDVDPVGCAAAPLPDHIHDVGITFANVTLAGTVGLGRGLALTLELPFDAKVLSRRYSTLDGEPFDPPYGDIHHRDETLAGLGDPRIFGRWDVPVPQRWQLGVRAGATVPLGDTVENPDPLAAMSLEHEHMQIGSGTIDPVGGVFGGRTWGPWGVFARVDLRIPVYASNSGYRGGRQLDAAVGPGYRFSRRRFIATQLAWSHSGEETWDGVPNESSGRDEVRVIVSADWGITQRIRIAPIAQLELASRAVGGSFQQPLIATFNVIYGSPIPTGRGFR